MAKKRRKKRGASLPRSEVWIVLAFVLSFLAWGLTRCDFGFRDIIPAKETATIEEKDISNTDGTDNSNELNNGRRETIHVTELYITIDSFNFRTIPKLDGTVIKKLRLSERVVYLNEITDFTQKIYVDPNWENEPWIKVRTIEGEEGWVYGAGVSYYDEAHKKPIESNE